MEIIKPIWVNDCVILLREAKTEYERVITEAEEYKKDYPFLGRTIELKTGLNEEEKCEQYEHIIKGLKKNLSDANLDILRLESTNVEKDYQLKTAMHRLSVCQGGLDKNKRKTG